MDLKKATNQQDLQMIKDNSLNEIRRELEWKQKFQDINSDMSAKQNMYLEKVAIP